MAPDAHQLAQRLARVAAGGSDPEGQHALMSQVDALFAANQHVVYATCLRFLGDQQQALEVAQDALLRAYEKLPYFRGDARFSTWLVSIARYECLNARRKHGELLTEDGVVDASDPVHSTLSAMRRRERAALVRDAAAAVLEPMEQEAVVLRYTENLPIKQIEVLLDLDAASGARGLLQRCRRKLGKELQRRLELMGQGTSFLRSSLD